MKIISDADKDLLNAIQRDFPVTPAPFQDLADQLGEEQINQDEKSLLERLNRLKEQGIVNRFGAIFSHSKAGASTLCAMAVPNDQIDTIADQINSYPGVNHNYWREHHFNLWFVLTAHDQEQLQKQLDDIAMKFDFPLLDLPMEHQFFIDLGFPL